MQKATLHEWSLFRIEIRLILQGTLTFHTGEKKSKLFVWIKMVPKKRKCNEFLICISNFQESQGHWYRVSVTRILIVVLVQKRRSLNNINRNVSAIPLTFQWRHQFCICKTAVLKVWFVLFFLKEVGILQWKYINNFLFIVVQ